MLNRELKDLHTNLTALSNVGGSKLAYIIGKNIKIIADELTLIEKSITIPNGYKEFQKDRISLCTLHSHKNEDGSPKMIDNNYDIIDYATFVEEFKMLKEKYETDIMKYEAVMTDLETLLNEESTIEFQKIKLDLIPDEYEGKPTGPLVLPLISLIAE